FGRHPRLAILGPLEARLQPFDVVVLGGLNEGTWPRSAAADPWLSRPMRERLGLESPERSIGLAAHDFATLAAVPDVRLTRALKVDGVPTVASRWLQRLQQLARGLGQEQQLSKGLPFAGYVQMFAVPDEQPKPAPAPGPRPPVSERPRELSVTEIEKWLRDPYAVYARRILRLRALDPLDAEVGPMDRGSDSTGPSGPFVLKGRADRIDSLHGAGAAGVDYKTGRPPTDPQVAKFAPQLPLEGAILEHGGFGDIGALVAAQLVYIRFSGAA